MSEEIKKENTVKKETKVKSKSSKKINKKALLIVVIAIVVIVVAVLIFKNSNKRVIKTATNEIDMNNTENVEIIDGKKVNNSESIKNRKNIESIGSIENLEELRSLTCKITELSATSKESKVIMEVTNESNKDFEGKEVTITFYEKEGRIFGELKSYIGKIKAGERIQLEVTTTLDVTNAYDYSVEIHDANI